MIALDVRDGLLFISLVVEYQGEQIVIDNALVDTGSAATVLSASRTEDAGISYEPDDILHRIRGVGGSEFVYEKTMNAITIGTVRVADFAVQISGMDYGFEIDAIVGLDLLTRLNAIIDMRQLQIIVAIEGIEQGRNE